MLKENGRLTPMEDKQELARIFGKAFKCGSCEWEFRLKEVEFGKEVRCPICDGLAQEIID